MTEEEKDQKQEILVRIKNTLELYQENVPMEQYLFLAKEYKRICISFDKLLSKEKDRNRKFIEVKRELLTVHQEEIKNLKDDIKTIKFENENLKIDVLKYKMIVKDQENSKADEHTQTTNEKPILLDEINNLIMKHFSEEQIKIIFDDVITHLASTTLDFSKITLSFFDDNKILLLQRAIYRRVMVIIKSDSSSIVSPITNTILRDNYNYVHKEFAKKALEASNISRGVFKFFENHFVEDDTGTRWNSFAITRFMGEYLKQTESYYCNKDEFKKYSARLIDFNHQELSLMDETNEKMAEFMAERKKVEKLVSLYKLRIADEEGKISNIIEKYKSLLEGVTKTLLQKRIIMIK